MSLVCQATGQPKPTVTWRKAFSKLVQVIVVDQLRFILTPQSKIVVSVFSNIMLNCMAESSIGILCKKASKNLPQSHILYPNGTLLLRKVSPNDAGT